MKPSFLNQVTYDHIFTPGKNYYQATCSFPPEDPYLSENTSCDVVVVGGGLSGLSTALRLSKKHGLSVIVLERHFVGWGASGRNGGQIVPGFMPPTARVIKSYGLEVTKQLWDLSVAGVTQIIKNIEEYNIECDLRKGYISPVTAKRYQPGAIEGEIERGEQLGYHTTLLNEQETTEALGCKEGYYKAALLDSEHAYHFHPLKYLLSLKKILKEKHNVQFYEDTEVIGVDSSKKDVIVYTPEGYISAKKVVLCGDSYLGMLSKKLRRKYVLIRNAIVATEPLKNAESILPGNQCVAEYNGQLLFYRKTPDNRLILGGGDTIRPDNDRLNTEEKIKDLCKNSMVKLFPQLDGTDVEYVWGGYIGVTSSYLPYTGSEDGKVYYMGGYSGHGINLTHILGNLVADSLATENPVTNSAFDNIFNISMPGLGNFDIPLAKIGMLLESIKEKFD